MRADRLLSILLSLRAGGVTSAKTLAEKLEVSERTIYRDIDALSFSGFPVYAVRGVQGGYALDKHFRMDLTDVTLSEVKNLLIVRSPRPLSDLGFGSNQRTIHKLIMNLPGSRRAEINQFSKRIYLDSACWFGIHDKVPCLTAIESAMKRNLQIHIDYQKGNGKIISREIAPYGLAAKTDSWYLIAKHENVLRVYRVSRVQNVKPTGQSFLFPKDFNVARFWKDWCREFEESRPIYSVILRMNPENVPELQINKSRIQDLNQGERSLFRIQFETFKQAEREILSLGPKAEVIQPADLRERIREKILQSAEIYREKAADRK
ncbi:WYL domain-containing protein [Sporolactobacillus sp. CQH2019]|uniref:helix-turn-helix transcriptional regulator n=1 Tax=Sporolactobacillus sp. CQH2019 TaxID=3023512 RepID=UPI00236867AE|nr:WYL domain-containing protein [Sporolactobacillus sp. CQH2019]MDD9149789.1 WYL domain-containing protein [Sporolactobacillus sp. CQH2019]